MLVSEFIIFVANNNNELREEIIYILFWQPSFPGTMDNLNNDIKRLSTFGSEPRLVQAPDQIFPISVKDEPQTSIFVLAEWHDGRFLPVMVLLAVWLLS